MASPVGKCVRPPGIRILSWLVFLALAIGVPRAVAQTAPTITTQPQSLTVNPGYPATLTVAVSGTGTLSYRWFKNATPLSDGGGLSGTLTATLSLASAQTSDGGSYSVTVSNSGGSVTSNIVTLTVAIIYVPVFTSANSLSVLPSAPISFAVAATNSPTAFGATGLPAGLSIDPATGIISGTTTTQGIYSVVVSATNGIGTATQNFSLTVEAVLPSYAGKLLSGWLPSSFSNLAVDAVGNLFVADAGNHTIVKITPDAVSTIVAGKATQGGSADGIGSTALFLSPGGVAVDSGGNLYVADTGNHTIRKIATDGTVSTFAGSAGLGGSADGTGSAARFLLPKGIAVDALGTLYIADTGNHTIRKISPVGAVSTLAGSPGVSGNTDGNGLAARFNLPNSLALDYKGTIYVTDGGNNAVRKISSLGAVTTLAATFNQPTGIALDNSGNIFVADTNNNTLKEITAVGTSRAISVKGAYQFNYPWGAQGGPSPPPAVSGPTGIAVDSGGNLFWFASGMVSNTSIGGLQKASPFFPIVITSPPQNQTVAAGATAQFSVTATGQPLNYAWYGPPTHYSNRNVDYPVGQNSSGSTLSVVAQASGRSGFSDGYLTNAGTYGVIVYNVGGSVTATALLAMTFTPPQIMTQPQPLTVNAGSSATFSVAATMTPSSLLLTYDWRFNGVQIGSTDSPSYTIANVQPTNAGSYQVFVYSVGGSVASNPVALTVNPPTAPQITTQPQALTVKAGASASFSVTSNGTPAPTYQWSFNGTSISGATNSTYTLATAQPTNAGSYQVTAYNSTGSVTSNPVALVVVSPPVVASAPQATTVYAGNPVTLSVTASGLTLSYQWQLNGVAIAGATDATLTLSNAQLANAGNYSVVISNLAGSLTTTPVAVDVVTTRLVNLSVRGPVGGGNILIVGFVTNGSTAKQLLIRGIGPTLALFGVSSALSTPQLTLFDSQRSLLGVNGGWGGGAALSDMFVQVGAFALPANSADSALLRNLSTGLYSAQLNGVGSTAGVGLAEIYDADSATVAPRLINLSARGFTGNGGDVLIAGFVIAGNHPSRILVRAIGPTLASFAVSGALANPQLVVVESLTGKAVASNTVWGGDAALSAVFTQVGAFSLPLSSNDSALLATLPPGGYTALVTGVAGTTGIALVEVYEVP